MISKDIQVKLVRIIKDMIPEYKNSKIYKEELKKVFIEWVTNSYLTERDNELISKFPDFISKDSSVPIVGYYSWQSEGIDIETFKGYWMRDEGDLKLDYDRSLPRVTNTIYELKEDNKEGWKKIGPHFYKYINARNAYIKKLNLAYDFLTHKNTTITLIKKEFPELYKLYRS